MPPLQTTLNPIVTAYLLVTWVLAANSTSNGLGFPFDQPHLVFYQRLQQVGLKLKQLLNKGVLALPTIVLTRVLSDPILQKTQVTIEEKINVFNELREAMRIACTDSELGLNDEGDDDIDNIEQRVTAFRHSDKLTKLAANNTSYSRMIKQIDKYWEKLFAKQIHANTPVGKIIIQPQRTNNLMEQTFRYLKRGRRKKSGQHSLSRALVGMLADTPLVRNYMDILLKGKNTLAERFADIDAEETLKIERENDAQFDKYPRNIRRLFKLTNLPEILMEAA